MRKSVLLVALVLALSVVAAVPAMAAPRMHNENISIDLGGSVWPSSFNPWTSKYGGYLDLYFPFEEDLSLFVWFHAFYPGYNEDPAATPTIGAVSEIGLQMGFNPYFAVYCGALYGFNDERFKAVDPVVGVLARLPLGNSADWYFKAGVSYYFDPDPGVSVLDNVTVHYGTYLVFNASDHISVNLGVTGYYGTGQYLGSLIPAAQLGLGYTF